MSHMKKLLPLILALVLAMSYFTAVSASNETELVTYPVNGGSIYFDPAAGAVTGYEGAIVDLNIPAKINGVDVVTIRDEAFNNCGSLSSVVLPDSLTTIEEFAFANCFFLTSVELPDSLTSLGASTFACCGDITSITIPDSVMTIGAGAFSGCTMLEGIWVGENNPNYCSDENGVLFNKDKTELVAYPGALAGEYVIPDSITTIGDSAFLLCEKLIGITIPDGVTSIDANAFEHCYNLTDVVIPGSVKTIGEYAFVFCEGLTEIIIQEGVTTIGDGAFQSCYNLTDVTIPGSVSYIGATSFLNCGSLIDITIPEGVTTIGAMAFDSCYSLTSIEIPVSITTIGFDVFYDCNNLTDIYYGGSEEQWNEISFDDNDFSSVNIHFNSTMPELVSYSVPGGSILFNPATGTVTGYEGDPTEIDIPDKINGVPVVAIADDAFYNCDNLTKIALPDSLTTIGDAAFLACYGLTSITFPDSLTTIGEAAFRGCEGLTSIALPDGLTTIGDAAFRECYNLTAIAFPDHLEHIGWIAFEYCESLITLTIPDGVTTIDDWAFEYCYSLESVAIPASVTFLGADAFIGCPLTHIYYGGTQAQWEELSSYNDFSGITVHYNETAPWHDCPGNDFADIPFFNNWAHNGIDYCVENELMNGVGNNLFSPNGTVSRAQLVTILYRMAGSPATEFKNTFTDVADGLWYSDAIEWAAANGVVNGVGDGKFAPDRSITREQIATILYRYHGSPAVSGSLGSFPDANSVSDFATNGLLWATQQGLINGVSSNGVTSLAPQNNATRAQIAAIIMRYCEAAEAA